MKLGLNNKKGTTYSLEIEEGDKLLAQLIKSLTLKQHDIIKNLEILGKKVEESILSSTTKMPSLKEITFTPYLEEHPDFQNNLFQNKEKIDGLYYTALIVMWCLPKNGTERRLQKINHPAAHLHEVNRHHIKLGVRVLDAFITGGKTSNFIQTFDPPDSIESVEDSEKCVEAITQWHKTIQAYRTQAQEFLKYFGYLLMISMVISGIGSTVALFSGLLSLWPSVAVGVSLLMITANLWMKARGFQGISNNLANILGLRGLSLTEWIDENGKRNTLASLRKWMLYFSLGLSVMVGANIAWFVYMGLLSVKSSLFFFLAMPPVALLLAFASFICITIGSMNSFLNTLKEVDPIQNLFIQPFKTIQNLFKSSQAFNNGKSPLRLDIAQYMTYFLFAILNLIGVAAILIGGYLSIPILISNVLIPIGFSYTQAFIISCVLNLGLLPLGNFLLLIKTTANAWGEKLAAGVYRMLCGPLPVNSLESTSKEVTLRAMVEEKLTQLFGFCILIESGLRFYKMKASNNLKARSLVAGFKTYFLATQIFAGLGKQNEVEESRRELQIYVAEKASSFFRNCTLEEEKSSFKSEFCCNQ